MRCRLGVLSADEMRDIHAATLEILEYVGATFRSKEALKIFDDFGATVDQENLLTSSWLSTTRCGEPC